MIVTGWEDDIAKHSRAVEGGIMTQLEEIQLCMSS